MKEITRFTLETRIEECNRVLEDLDTALKITETEDIDRIQNTLIGVKEIYNQRFQDLWREFEQLIALNKIV